MLSFEFTCAFGKLVVLPQPERRYANPNKIQIDLMQRIQRVLGIPIVNCCVTTSTLLKTGGCYACIKDLVGTRVYKERHEKLNTRVKTSCSICNVLTCKQHIKLSCAKCNDR